MMDVLLLVAGGAVFLLADLYVAGCDRLRGSKP